MPTTSKTIPTTRSNEDYHNGNELDSEVGQSESNSFHSTVITEPAESTTHKSTTDSNKRLLTTSESIQSESKVVTNLETTPLPNLTFSTSTNPVLTAVFATSTHGTTRDIENLKNPSFVTENVTSIPSTSANFSLNAEQDAESLLPVDLDLVMKTSSTLSSNELNIDNVSSLKELNINNVSTSSLKDLNMDETTINETTTLLSAEMNMDEVTTLTPRELKSYEVNTLSPKEPNIDGVTTSLTGEMNTNEIPTSQEDLATPEANQNEESKVNDETPPPFSIPVVLDAESLKFASTSTDNLLIVSSTETLMRAMSKAARLDIESETSQPDGEQDASPSRIISETAASSPSTETSFKMETTEADLSSTVPPPSTELSIDSRVSMKVNIENNMTENITTEPALSSDFTEVIKTQSTIANMDNELTSESNSFDDLSTIDAETFMNNHVFEITEQATEEASATISSEDYSDLAFNNSDSEITNEETENGTSRTDKELHLSSETSEIPYDTTPIPFLYRTAPLNESIAPGHDLQKGENVSEVSTKLNSDAIAVSSDIPTYPETAKTSTVSVDEISSTDSSQTTHALPSDYFYPIENVSDSLSRNITHLFESDASSPATPDSGVSSTQESDVSSTTTLEEGGISNHIPLMISTEEQTGHIASDTTISETLDTIFTVVSETDTTATSESTEDSSHFNTISSETPSSSLFTTMATHREGKHILFSTTNSKDKSEENPPGGVIVVTTSQEMQGTEKSWKIIPVLHTEYEDLTSEQKANIITSVVQLPSNYNSEEVMNEKITQVHQWMYNVLETEFRNRTKNYLNEEIKSNVYATNQHSLELVYIHPTPDVHFSNISFTFYAYDNTLNETLPAYFLLSSLRTKSEELLSLVNANATYFYHGLLPEKYDFLTVIIEKYGTIVAATCLAALVLIILLVCVVIYYRRKTRYSAHNLTNNKLHRNMQEAMGLDLNPAVVILQDELKEKAMNGNKVSSLDDNEGWLVPFTDVPLAEDKDAPRVQDTKL